MRHYLEARARAHRGNVHFFHYADMTRDLPGQINRLSDLLGIPLSNTLRKEIAEATNFGAMRKAAESSKRRFGEETPFRDFADFFASGTSNKWEGRLHDLDMDAYKRRIAEVLPPEEVAWLEWGEKREP